MLFSYKDEDTDDFQICISVPLKYCVNVSIYFNAFQYSAVFEELFLLLLFF